MAQLFKPREGTHGKPYQNERQVRSMRINNQGDASFAQKVALNNILSSCLENHRKGPKASTNHRSLPQMLPSFQHGFCIGPNACTAMFQACKATGGFRVTSNEQWAENARNRHKRQSLVGVIQGSNANTLGSQRRHGSPLKST